MSWRTVQADCPSRFPVGTKFVIEGRRAGEGQVQVFNRYLEFPDGTLFRLPARPASANRRRPRRIRRARSIDRRRDLTRPGRSDASAIRR